MAWNQPRQASEARHATTLPFTNEEVERTITAATGFRMNGSSGCENLTRVMAYIYLLCYFGLRIFAAPALRKVWVDVFIDVTENFHKVSTEIVCFVPLTEKEERNDG
jgi:hypothetical protein